MPLELKQIDIPASQMSGMTAIWSVSIGRGLQRDFPLASEKEYWKLLLQHNQGFGKNIFFLADAVQADDWPRYVIEKEDAGPSHNPPHYFTRRLEKDRPKLGILKPDAVHAPRVVTDEVLIKKLEGLTHPCLEGDKKIEPSDLAEMFSQGFEFDAIAHGKRYKAEHTDLLKDQAWQWNDAISALQEDKGKDSYNYATVLQELKKNGVRVSQFREIAAGLTDKEASFIVALQRLQTVALTIKPTDFKTVGHEKIITYLQTLDPLIIGPQVCFENSLRFVMNEVALMMCFQKKYPTHVFLYPGKPILGLDSTLKNLKIRWVPLHFFNRDLEPAPASPSKAKLMGLSTLNLVASLNQKAERRAASGIVLMEPQTPAPAKEEKNPFSDVSDSEKDSVDRYSGPGLGKEEIRKIEDGLSTIAASLMQNRTEKKPVSRQVVAAALTSLKCEVTGEEQSNLLVLGEILKALCPKLDLNVNEMEYIEDALSEMGTALRTVRLAGRYLSRDVVATTMGIVSQALSNGDNLSNIINNVRKMMDSGKSQSREVVERAGDRLPQQSPPIRVSAS